MCTMKLFNGRYIINSETNYYEQIILCLKYYVKMCSNLIVYLKIFLKNNEILKNTIFTFFNNPLTLVVTFMFNGKKL